MLDTVDQYTNAVKALLKSTHLPDEIYKAAADAISHASEMSYPDVRAIDRVLFGECKICREPLYGNGNECDCQPRED